MVFGLSAPGTARWSLAAQAARSRAPVMSTVVLLTALDLEYQAIRRHLVGAMIWSHPAGTLFEAGRLPGVLGTVVLVVTGEGNVSAAVLAERAIAMFAPRALLCVGVAGGLKEDIALGDIVVATKIYALHGGRDHPDGFLARPRAWQASHELEQIARHVARAGTWRSLVPGDLAPPAAPDRLADTASRAREAHQAPAVHFKPIASGEVVLTATGTSLATRLRDTYNDAAAVEMESAGIAQAAHMNRSLPVLSVRGISDRADPAKHLADAAGWQHIAASRAAAFTMAIAALALHDERRSSPARKAQRSAIAAGSIGLT